MTLKIKIIKEGVSADVVVIPGEKKEPQHTQAKIAIIGDSLMAGVQKHLPRSYVRAAVGGSTIGKIAGELLSNVRGSKVVIANGGVNNFPGCTGMHSTEYVSKAWKKIISKTMSQGAVLVIVPIFKVMRMQFRYPPKANSVIFDKWAGPIGEKITWTGKWAGSTTRKETFETARQNINSMLEKAAQDNKNIFYIKELENTTPRPAREYKRRRGVYRQVPDGLHYSSKESAAIAVVIKSFINNNVLPAISL